MDHAVKIGDQASAELPARRRRRRRLCGDQIPAWPSL